MKSDTRRPQRSAAAPMTTDRAILNFLNSFPENARAEGALLHEQGQVTQIFGNHLHIEGRVEIGDEVDRARLAFREEVWTGKCSCGEEECPALYATMLERIARGENLPDAPNEVGEKSIQELLEEGLGRILEREEEEYLAKLERRYRRYEMEGEIFDHDLVRLSGKWEVQGFEPLDLWPVKPANILEFWNYVAYTFQKKNVRYPKFMDVITDLNATHEKMRAWEREREIVAWREQISEIAVLPPNVATDEVTFRLMVTTSEARLQVRWDSREVKRPQSFSLDGIDDEEPAPAPTFETVSTKEAVDGLVEKHHLGALQMDAPSNLLWIYFIQYWEATQQTEIRLEKRQGAELLNHLFRQKILEDRVVSLDENAFLRIPDLLRWECLDTADGEYFQLRLVTAENEPLPYALRLLPGTEVFYLSDEALFKGPDTWGSLEVLPEYLIPRDAIASTAGVEFLAKIQSTLPESLRPNVEDRILQVTLEMRLEGKVRSDTEVIFLKVYAEDAEALRREELKKEGWEIVRKPRIRGKLLRFNRRILHRFPFLIEPIVSSWDAQQEAFRIRMTKTFPNRFRDWAKALPPEVRLDLDEKLGSLLDVPVEATVQFELEERDMDWFDLRIRVNAEGVDLTEKEVKLLVAARGDFVRMEDGTWRRLAFKLDHEQKKAIHELGLDPYDLSGESHRMHVLQLAGKASKEVFDHHIWTRICERSSSLQLQVRPKLPEQLTNVSLRPYQIDGFQFLAYLATNRFGGILADDMGLGKTVQSLTWLLWLRSRMDPDHVPPCLVVCPKSVLDVWAAEVEKFAPSLRLQVLRNKDELDLERLHNGLDMLVLNYAQLRVCIDQLKDVQWLAVVLDEGQQIKNPDSKAAKASRTLKAHNRLVLTGTPLENRLLDIWSLMSFAMPGILGDRKYFREHFDRRKDGYAQSRLAARLRPFMLRRTKDQVAVDLPPRTEEDVLCKLEDLQEKLYQEELERIRAILSGSETDDALKKNSFVILQGLMRLRQICCHPGLIRPELMEAPSAKLTALFYLIDQLQEEGHKVLVFSQFTSMLAIIKTRLEKENRPHCLLTGQTKNRQEVVQNFQRSKEPTCFLLSLKAGGSGLNLTAASYVVLYDPWWNPAVENQAIDRTHRIGQTSKVIAYRLLMRDSVEEKIRILQKKKTDMMTGVLGEESFTRNLERKDLDFLFGNGDQKGLITSGKDK